MFTAVSSISRSELWKFRNALEDLRIIRGRGKVSRGFFVSASGKIFFYQTSLLYS